jgi:hypothetical protein
MNDIYIVENIKYKNKKNKNENLCFQKTMAKITNNIAIDAIKIEPPEGATHSDSNLISVSPAG